METLTNPDLRSTFSRLRAEVRGDVLDDPLSLGLYATDASFYQITPLAVVVPRNRAALVRAVRIAAEAGAPILPRGGGTSLAGQTVNRAVVLDCSKYMNRLLELNVEEGWARVEPGIVRDELNALLKPHALQFAPDPASGNRANVGGMIATNAAGMRSIRHGMTIDHVLAVDLALSTGEILNLKSLTDAEMNAKCKLRDREGEIYRGFRKIIEANRDEIDARYPKVKRRSGGYAFDAFLSTPPWEMARLVTGSEGTLGVILEARVKLVSVPNYSGMVVVHFTSLREALRAVAPIVGHGPTAVELIDSVIIDVARDNWLTRRLCGFMEGNPRALLVVEDQGASRGEVEPRLDAVIADLRARGLGFAYPKLINDAAQNDVWVMRKNGEALMNSISGDAKPIGFVEDAAVPLEVLPDYIDDVLAICERHGQRVSLYAHASVGLIHVRPMLDLHTRAGLDEMKSLAEEIFRRVVHYKGAWSGEHGDGIVRGGFNERYFGPKLYAAFRELKRLFDPPGLMNPGKVIDTPPMDENQRYGPAYRVSAPATMFHYREQGGFRTAVENCTGVGVCRATLAGVMCPSYRATRDEEHSTRGRANALRLAITGQLPGGLASDRLHEALDLCLSCKACKSECPTNVDMARLKAEALHARHGERGARLRDRIFRDAARAGRLAAGPHAPLVNAMMTLRPVRAAMDRWFGLEARRALPTYARERLSTWFARRAVGRGYDPTLASAGARPHVALFCDTFIEYHEPHVGRAAVEVLEAAGYEVVLARAGCCQRPAISKGFLDVARREGERTMRALDALTGPQNSKLETRNSELGLPILVIEPSCASALADDLPDLIEDETLGRRVAARVKPIDQFLEEELAAGRCTLPWRVPIFKFQVSSSERRSVTHAGDSRKEFDNSQLETRNLRLGTILLHGHCHQKALFGTAPTLALLSRIPGAEVRELETGCCGMAGSFGYEKEHYDLSLKIAADRLLPALREAPEGASVAACGFSCRHQIADLAHRPARHAIELVREALLTNGY
jgi:FAD/FMN-containing dehydrogenase/Fe-S oxidoreductase